MRLTFGSVEVQFENREQAQKISQIAYKTKEVVQRRYGAEMPVLKANIQGDTVTFSCAEKNTGSKKQDISEGVLMNFLRQVNIPFKVRNN